MMRTKKDCPTPNTRASSDIILFPATLYTPAMAAPIHREGVDTQGNEYAWMVCRESDPVMCLCVCVCQLTGKNATTQWPYYAHEEDGDGYEARHLVLPERGQGKEGSREVKHQGGHGRPQKHPVPHLWGEEEQSTLY